MPKSNQTDAICPRQSEPSDAEVQLGDRHYTYSWMSSSLTAAGVRTPRSVKSKLIYSAHTYYSHCACACLRMFTPSTCVCRYHSCAARVCKPCSVQYRACKPCSVQYRAQVGVRHSKAYLVGYNLAKDSRSWLPAPSRDRNPHVFSPLADPADSMDTSGQTAAAPAHR